MTPTGAHRLRALADRYWAFQCHESPLYAVLAGEDPSDPALFRESPSDHERRAEGARSLLAELRAVDRDALEMHDRATCDLLRHELEIVRDLHEVGAHLRPSLTPTGPALMAAYFANSTGLDDGEAAERYVDRLATLPDYLGDVEESLRAGAERGFRYPRLALERATASLRAVVQTPWEQQPWLGPFRRSPAAGTTPLRRQADRLEGQLRTELPAAFERLASFLEGLLGETARDSLACIDDPQGRELYQVLVRQFTTTGIGPEEVHELGLAEVDRLDAEMRAIAAEAGFARDLAGYRRFLAGDGFVAPSKEALLETLRALCKRIDGRIPAYFGRIPRITYGVEPIPEAAAARLPPAYAQPNPADRSSPGVFWITSLPERCPSTLHPSLALHEAWPGHLMHIALMQEATHLPAFRRHGSVRYPACVEGWAIYCEGLGVEMDLYETPHQHFGRLEMEMWRALRLVVDTGIHWYGWDRQRAAAAMAEHLSLSPATIEVEIDRYVCWPGQALAYQVGNLAFRDLRRRAERRLATRFNLRRFHDALLGVGAVSLPVLADLVDGWIDLEERAARMAGSVR